MALNYLSIPGKFLTILLNFLGLISFSATLVEVEHLFSCGQLVLSHTCSHLSAQLTHALLCVSSWSLAGLVLNEDVKVVASLDEVQGKLELDTPAALLGKTH